MNVPDHLPFSAVTSMFDLAILGARMNIGFLVIR